MLLKVKIGKGEIFFRFFVILPFVSPFSWWAGGTRKKKTNVLSRLSAVSTAIAVPLVLRSIRVSQKESSGSISFSPAFSKMSDEKTGY